MTIAPVRRRRRQLNHTGNRIQISARPPTSIVEMRVVDDDADHPIVGRCMYIMSVYIVPR